MRAMRHVLVVFVCVLGCALFVPSASANSAVHVVYPTGSAATDVANVQAAVDAGGVVLLKATDAAGAPAVFEFGTGRVLLTNDVVITGETVHGVMTTVHHGIRPFRSSPGLQALVTIKNIHFDSPLSAAVLITSSRGFDFTGNVVTDVFGSFFFGETKGQAVWVTDSTQSKQIVGHITIANNLVERVHADLSYGVAFAVFDASVDIHGNTFRDTKDTGVVVVGGSQPISIDNNVILGGAPEPGFFSAGNGIAAGLGSGPLSITRNTIVCDNPYADGIALEGVIDFNPSLGGLPNEVPASSVIALNDITMHGSSYGAVSIYGQISPSLVTGNKISGDASYAVDISPFNGDETTSGTAIIGNRITQFQAQVSDVFLDYIATNTLVIGHGGTAIDNGVNNHISGFTSPVAAAARPLFRASGVQKSDLLATPQLDPTTTGP
jgi:hypothetical protein